MRRWLTALVLSVGLLGSVASVTGTARAQDQGQTQGEGAASERATAFRAVTGATKEHVPGGTLMVTAYALVWLLLLGLVVRIGRLQARTSREIEQLERDIGGKAGSEAARGGGQDG